jgi:hypothetical protein
MTKLLPDLETVSFKPSTTVFTDAVLLALSASVTIEPTVAVSVISPETVG